jgi:uncharacterized membrane protein YkvA (DUF1232 family)
MTSPATFDASGYAPLVRALLDAGNCKSLFDYDGPQCARDREPADLLVSIGTLEHVEADLLDECLDEAASMTRRFALVAIEHSERPLSWWLPKLGQRFDLIHWQDAREGLFVLACPKGMYRKLDAEIGMELFVRTALDAAPPRASAVKDSIQAMQRDVGTLWLAARDERTPWYAKAVAGAASFLAISPIDLTPDFVPVVGYLDDILVLFLGTFLAVRMIPAPLMAELRGRAATIEYPRASHGAIAIGSFWVAATFVALLHSSRFFA